MVIGTDNGDVGDPVICTAHDFLNTAIEANGSDRIHISAVLEYPQRHAVNVEEYLRMGEAGVFAPEAWVVDLQERAPRVFRDPSASGYHTSFTARGEESVSALSLPAVVVAIPVTALPAAVAASFGQMAGVAVGVGAGVGAGAAAPGAAPAAAAAPAVGVGTAAVAAGAAVAAAAAAPSPTTPSDVTTTTHH